MKNEQLYLKKRTLLTTVFQVLYHDETIIIIIIAELPFMNAYYMPSTLPDFNSYNQPACEISVDNFLRLANEETGGLRL